MSNTSVSSQTEKVELYPNKRNEEVQQHLEHLLEMFPNELCFVVWDNSSGHTTPMLWPFSLGQQEYLAMVDYERVPLMNGDARMGRGE